MLDSSITFFEATTALAFDYFSQKNVDIAIIETGLGGRLDSTNVLSPVQTIITEIHYDHTHILGNSIEEITAEKCGIFKDNTPSITINSDKRVLNIIQEHASAKNVQVSFIQKKDIIINDHSPESISFEYKNKNFSLPQGGSYQAQNAVLAIRACKDFSPAITYEAIQIGLDRWSWPGRMQLMKEDFFYDVAHNRNGIGMLVEDLRQLYDKKPIGVVVLKKDKINPKLIEIFDKSFDKIIISTISSKDILNKKEIKENPLLEKFEFIENLNDALDAIDKMNYTGGKVVFGSHYIAKDVYNFFDFFFDNGTI